MNNTACFTGHRPNKLGGYDPKDNKELLWKLRDIIIDHIENKGITTFITGMALGVDTWAARIVLKLKEKEYPKIKLIAAIPCKDHEKKWNKSGQEEWHMIVDSVDQAVYVSEEEYTSYCMQNRNKWMVDNSRCIIAVWDGSAGGTENCVRYAEKHKKLITRLNPSD